jgi:hypothetical protein
MKTWVVLSASFSLLHSPFCLVASLEGAPSGSLIFSGNVICNSAERAHATGPAVNLVTMPELCDEAGSQLSPNGPGGENEKP